MYLCAGWDEYIVILISSLRACGGFFTSSEGWCVCVYSISRFLEHMASERVRACVARHSYPKMGFGSGFRSRVHFAGCRLWGGHADGYWVRQMGGRGAGGALILRCFDCEMGVWWGLDRRM